MKRKRVTRYLREQKKLQKGNPVQKITAFPREI